MIHELVWAQCLENANHRTSVLLAQILVEGVQPALRDDADFARCFAESFDRFADHSKKLFKRRGEFGYGQNVLKERHQANCERFVAEVWGDQSRHLEMIGAQRLMDFFVSDDFLALD